MGLVIGLLLAAVIGFLGYQWYKLRTVRQKCNWLKSVPGWPVLGNIFEFGDTTEVIYDFMRLMKKHGKFIFLDFVTKPSIFATDYDFLEFVLSSQSLINKSDEYKLLHLWLGTGLLTSGGKKWRKMRRILTPAFHFSILEQFIESFETNGQILIKKMEKVVGQTSFDIHKYINLYALDVICDTAMGVSINAQQDENSKYVTCVRNICTISIERAFSILKYMDFFFPFYKDYNVAIEAVNYLHSATYAVIDSRREILKARKNRVLTENDEDICRKKKKPFLDILLECTTENGEPLSREDIREEVDTFMFEGHDTTASAISFCLYSLANHPEVQKKALEEQHLIFGDDIYRNVTYNDLQEMKYLECVIKETLRLYPSVPIYTRLPEEDTYYKDTLAINMRLMEKYGKLFRMELILSAVIISADYDFTEFIVTSQKILNKSSNYEYFKNWLGTGLITSAGTKWKKRRHLITPAFHFSILEQFVDTFEKNGKILIKKLEPLADSGKDVDIYHRVSLYALDVICETAMGISPEVQERENSLYVQQIRELCRIVAERGLSVLKRYTLLYPFSKDYYKEKKAIKYVRCMTNSVIDSRKIVIDNSMKDGTAEKENFGRKKKMALVDILLKTKVNGEFLSRDDIREEVDTFMFAGHDTSSSTISFAAYLISRHPEVQQAILEEQKQIFNDDFHRNATYNDLQNMKYLERVIKESLRVYPTVPGFSRKVTEELVYKGHIIPKGVNIVIFTYALFKDPEHFPNPEKFDPSRFEKIDGKHPYAYIPFSAGLRNCIGQKFAMLETKSALSKILRNFELLPADPGNEVILTLEIILKSSNGMMMKLKKRI